MNSARKLPNGNPVPRDVDSRALPWKRVLQVLILLSAALAALSLAIPLATGVPYSNYDGILREYFDVGRESNFSTWWSSSLHLAAALGLAVVACIHRRQKMPGGTAWLLLAAIPLAFSIDEATVVHERMRHLTFLLFDDQVFEYAWVVVGAPLALGVLLVVAFCSFRLPRLPRNLLLSGFGVFFLGAVGVEVLHGFLIPFIGDEFLFNLIYHIEELFEMVGASLILVTPLAALQYRSTPDGLTVEPLRPTRREERAPQSS